MSKNELLEFLNKNTIVKDHKDSFKHPDIINTVEFSKFSIHVMHVDNLQANTLFSKIRRLVGTEETDKDKFVRLLKGFHKDTGVNLLDNQQLSFNEIKNKIGSEAAALRFIGMCEHFGLSESVSMTASQFGYNTAVQTMDADRIGMRLTDNPLNAGSRISNLIGLKTLRSILVTGKKF